MRTLVLRPLSTLGLLLLGLLVLRMAVWPKSGRRFAETHGGEVVLFEDSHADDVHLEGVPRFSTPGQDLVSTWMHMRALHDARPADSELKVVVLTIWPYKFGPLAERRLSGRLQDDNWGQSAFGVASPLARLSDFVEPALPWRFRWRLMLNAAQLHRTRFLKGVVCTNNPVQADYAPGLGFDARERSWFEEGAVSRWAFDRILDLCDEEGWELVLLEHPLHPAFHRQANPQAQADYDAAMRKAAEHPRVHYLALGRDSVPHTAFRDFHHLTCEGGEYVATHLDPLLAELVD